MIQCGARIFEEMASSMQRPFFNIYENTISKGLPRFERLYRIFHGDHSGQWLIASSAQAVDFSAWQVVHGFGILN
jgi:hypothetical protein